MPGGAIACTQCTRAVISACDFRGNQGLFGGAVALIQPAQESSIASSNFSLNSATAVFSNEQSANANCLISPDTADTQQQQQGVCSGEGIGMDAASSGDGLYPGGGGMYLELGMSPISVDTSQVQDNAGVNGGEGCDEWAAAYLVCPLALS